MKSCEQTKLLIQVPPTRSHTQLERPIARLRRERHHVPPRARHVQHLRYVPPTSLLVSSPDPALALPGSDGTVNFWDKDARTRLKSTSLPLLPYPILLTHPPFSSLFRYSVRPSSRPRPRDVLQPGRHHLRLCCLVRLVAGPLGDDTGPAEQGDAACVQGR